MPLRVASATDGEKKAPTESRPGGALERCMKEAGRYLLSRRMAVSSAQGSLASVFGMGTGMSSPPWRPAQSTMEYGKRTGCPGGNGNMAKPHGLLVPLGCARRRACTCGLSTRYSPGGLQGDHVPRDA